MQFYSIESSDSEEEVVLWCSYKLHCKLETPRLDPVLTPMIWAMLRAANRDGHKYLTIDLYEEEVRRFSTEANTGEPRHAGKKNWPPWCALISVNFIARVNWSYGDSLSNKRNIVFSLYLSFVVALILKWIILSNLFFKCNFYSIYKPVH